MVTICLRSNPIWSRKYALHTLTRTRPVSSPSDAQALKFMVVSNNTPTLHDACVVKRGIFNLRVYLAIKLKYTSLPSYYCIEMTSYYLCFVLVIFVRVFVNGVVSATICMQYLRAFFGYTDELITDQ